MSSGTFMDLVQHEFMVRGSWRKLNRVRLSRSWCVSYILIVAAAVVIVTTYLAARNDLELSSFWYMTLAFPYWIFFLGYGAVKREWSNDTYGWWLTLPIPRFRLIAAKWLGNCLKVWIAMIAIYIALSAYVLILTSAIDHYTYDMAVSFMITGINWLTVVAGLTPFIIAAGMLTISIMYSTAKPLTPLLWVLFMGGFSIVYSNMNEYLLPEGRLETAGPATFFPFPWELPAIIIGSWAVAYGLIRAVTYVMDKKLDL
ncbi:ABC transporter permease subunit [Paenibacillus favisporus]|uniref:ABC transporter permease subunit n=1 Tax=Paenibacillus favisporus TaxID=221028 RepID=UPI0013D5AA91|nr:ABC transporter permease subunit [Paenibacillus favisporus]